MESFLEYIFLVLPALRIDSFLRRTRPTVTTLEASSTLEAGVVFELNLLKENITAHAILSNGEFVVQAGSMARQSWVGDRSDKTSYWKLHDELVASGVLTNGGDHRTFAENYAFSSTSAAGAVVTGRTTAGPISWKIQGTKQTYREWEAEKLALVVDE